MQTGNVCIQLWRASCIPYASAHSPLGRRAELSYCKPFPPPLCQALQHLRYPPQLPTFPSWWKSSLMPSCVVPLVFCPSGGTKSPSELQRYCWLGIVNTISMKVNRDGTYGPLVSGMLIMVRCCITHSGLDPALWQVALSPRCPPCEAGAGDGARRGSAVGKACPYITLYKYLCREVGFFHADWVLREKGSESWGEAPGIIWKRGLCSSNVIFSCS